MEAVQLRPDRSEEIAAKFDELAIEARAGNITGYSMVLIRPGGTYSCIGWQAKDRNALEEIGIYILAILDIWKGTLRE